MSRNGIWYRIYFDEEGVAYEIELTPSDAG